MSTTIRPDLVQTSTPFVKSDLFPSVVLPFSSNYMQLAREYALNALSRASEALKQVQGQVSTHATRPVSQDGSDLSRAEGSTSVGQSMSSVTSIVTQLATALSGTSLVAGATSSSSNRQDRRSDGGTVGGNGGHRSTVMTSVSTGFSSNSSGLESESRENIRVQRFKQELAGSCVNIHALKRLSFHGVPDRDNLRGLVWKVWRTAIRPVHSTS